MSIPSDYLKQLGDRAKESRAYTKHQLIGLEVAEMLEDRKHKALYIKLAKEGDATELLRIAKEVANKKNIKNPGAYFMKVISQHPTLSNTLKNKKRGKK